MPSNRRFWHTFLGCSAISVVYLILGWFHWRLVLVPAKPDEVAHLEYIVDILDGRFWPVMKKEISPCLDERNQPPLYYWVSAAVMQFTPTRDLGKWYTANPFFMVGAPRGNGAACLHFPQVNSLLMTGRILSWLLGTLTIWGTYRAMRVWLGPSSSMLITALVVLTPSITFVQTGINNMALFIPINVMIFGELSRIWKFGMTRKRMLRGIILLILGTYTRMEALLWWIPAGVILFRAIRRGVSIRSVTPYAAALASAISPLLLRNMLLYGDPFVHSAHSSRSPVPLSHWIQAELPMLLRMLFVSLGQGFISAPDYVYVLIAIVLLTGVSGVVLRALRRDLPSGVWLMLSHFSVLVLASVLLSLRYFVGAPRYIGAAGISGAAVWAIGYEGVWPRSIRRYALAATLVVWYFLHTIAITQVLIPVYTPRPAARSDHPVAILDGKILLHRAWIQPVYAKPGETIVVRLVWEALEPVPGNLAVFVHALDPEAPVIVAQEDTYPLYGNYPTMLWVPHQPFEDVHHIRLPGDLTVPCLRLTAGLYYYETMERLPAFSPNGKRFHGGGSDAIPIGQVFLVSRPEAPWSSSGTQGVCPSTAP